MEDAQREEHVLWTVLVERAAKRSGQIIGARCQQVLRIAEGQMCRLCAQLLQRQNVLLLARLHCLKRIRETGLPVPVSGHVLRRWRGEHRANNGRWFSCEK